MKSMTTLVLSLLIFSSTSSHGTFVDGVDEFEGPGWSWSRIFLQNATKVVSRIEYEADEIPGKPYEIRAILYDAAGRMLTTRFVVSIANEPTVDVEVAGHETHSLLTGRGRVTGFSHFHLANPDGSRLDGEYSILTWAVGPFTRWNVSLTTLDGSIDFVSATRGHETYAFTTNDFESHARLTVYPLFRANLMAKTQISADSLMIGTYDGILGPQPTERIWAERPGGDQVACPCQFLDASEGENWGPGAYTFHHFGVGYPAWYGNLPATPPPALLLGVIATPPP